MAMRRPIFVNSSDDVETNIYLHHRVSYDGQVGVNFYDYHDLDVIIMIAKKDYRVNQIHTFKILDLVKFRCY